MENRVEMFGGEFVGNTKLRTAAVGVGGGGVQCQLVSKGASPSQKQSCPLPFVIIRFAFRVKWKTGLRCWKVNLLGIQS